MFVHTVLWNLNPTATKDDFINIRNQLAELKRIIPEIMYFNMGIADKKTDGIHQICLVSHFKNEEEYIVYRDHPEHIKVKEQIAKLFTDRAVADVIFE